MRDAELVTLLREQLLADPVAADDPTRLRAQLARLLTGAAPVLPPARADAVVDAVVRDVVGFGPLDAVLRDPSVTEVMLNGPRVAYVERAGTIEPLDLVLDAAAIEHLAQRVIAPLGLRLDRAAPMVDARLPDGSRLHAVLPPLAPDGPVVTIRRFATRRLALADFDAGAAEPFLLDAVAGGANLLVAGATSAGKTTALQALSIAIPPGERIVTIEETAELRLPCPHVVRLETRPANSEGVGHVSVRELVRASLRMRPDRIVVGEVRGAEAFDMLQALNTGHDGSLCTVHANSARDALVRIETLALFAATGLPAPSIRRQISAALDLVVFVARAGAARRIELVGEVVDAGDDIDVRPLFARPDRGGPMRAVAAPSRSSRRKAGA
jgi:pilus assembly protein CpaF